MRVFYLFFLIVFCPSLAMGQINLVPNPSFEDTTNCLGFSTFNNSLPWFNPNAATPDYYSSLLNFCGYNRLDVNVINGIGYQLPHSGDSYSGIYVYLPGNPVPTREYIEVALNDTLLANRDYNVQFYVSRANNYGMAVDAIGAYFSVNPVVDSLSVSILSHNPQVENPSGILLIDSTNWILISGTFTAKGGERYLVIGNFLSMSNTNNQLVDSSINVDRNGYYFIDDVSVKLLDTAQSIKEFSANNSISLFPNPLIKGSHLSLNINNHSVKICKWELFNAQGELILYGDCKNGFNFNSSELKEGVYIMKINVSNSIMNYKLIILTN